MLENDLKKSKKISNFKLNFETQGGDRNKRIFSVKTTNSYLDILLTILTEIEISISYKFKRCFGCNRMVPEVERHHSFYTCSCRDRNLGSKGRYYYNYELSVRAITRKIKKNKHKIHRP